MKLNLKIGKPLIVLCVLSAGIAAGLILLQPKSVGKYNVGLVYIASHPAIDQGIEGYSSEIRENFPNSKIDLITTFSNANGEIKNINSLVQNYVRNDFDVVIAFTTPAAQVASRILEKIPLIFVGVSDPIEAGLVDTLNAGRRNITGTTSQVPSFEILELALSVFPEIRRVGIIYSSFEANSTSILKQIEAGIDKKGIPIVLKKRSISSTVDIHSVANVLADEVDAIFLINDNTVISAVPLILKAADKKGIPVFASDIDSVKKGAQFTLGLNYRDEGVAAGRILREILIEKTHPSEIPVYVNKQYYMYVNKNLSAQFPNANLEPLAEAKVI